MGSVFFVSLLPVPPSISLAVAAGRCGVEAGRLRVALRRGSVTAIRAKVFRLQLHRCRPLPSTHPLGRHPVVAVLHPAETLPTSCRLRSASIQYRFSTSALRATLSTLVKAGTKSLNMNIRAGLLDRIDKFRFKRMFSTRSQAIEFLLEVALKLNPKKPKDRKSAGRKEDR